MTENPRLMYVKLTPGIGVEIGNFAEEIGIDPKDLSFGIDPTRGFYMLVSQNIPIEHAIMLKLRLT